MEVNEEFGEEKDEQKIFQVGMTNGVKETNIFKETEGVEDIFYGELDGGEEDGDGVSGSVNESGSSTRTCPLSVVWDLGGNDGNGDEVPPLEAELWDFDDKLHEHKTKNHKNILCGEENQEVGEARFHSGPGQNGKAKLK